MPPDLRCKGGAMKGDGTQARRNRRKPATADLRRLAAANINPATGLSTDYLNLFGEAIMLLDLAPQAPEYRTELARWRPLTYCEYFGASQLAHRDLSIAAYEAARGSARRQFDSVCATMSAIIVASRSGVCGDLPPRPSPAAADAVIRLKALFARAGAIVNGLEAAKQPRTGTTAARTPVGAAAAS
jgi:hypothetical protein